MRNFKSVVLKLHLWTGLGLGLLLIVIGLSGSAIVYPTLLAPSHILKRQSPLSSETSLEQQIASARDVNPAFDGQTAIVTLPTADDATVVTFSAGRNGRRSGEARNRSQLQIYVDSGTAKVLGSYTAGPSPLVRTAHQIHESLLLGRNGRTLVGILGIAMTFLGLSGVYLWWPKANQWASAFLIRRSLRGAGLYREIHKAFGIWFFLVLVIVSATGVVIAFPSLSRALEMRGDGEGRRYRAESGIDTSLQIPSGGSRLSLHDIIADAEQVTGGRAITISVPAKPDRPVSVSIASSESAPPRNLSLNPYTGEAIGETLPSNNGGQLNVRALHEGRGLGPVYRLLVFITGFLPLLFVTSGFLLWLKRRTPRGMARGQHKPSNASNERLVPQQQ